MPTILLVDAALTGMSVFRPMNVWAQRLNVLLPTDTPFVGIAVMMPELISPDAPLALVTRPGIDSATPCCREEARRRPRPRRGGVASAAVPAHAGNARSIGNAAADPADGTGPGSSEVGDQSFVPPDVVEVGCGPDGERFIRSGAVGGTRSLRSLPCRIRKRCPAPILDGPRSPTRPDPPRPQAAIRQTRPDEPGAEALVRNVAIGKCAAPPATTAGSCQSVESWRVRPSRQAVWVPCMH